jgi:hypothetical protein
LFSCLWLVACGLFSQWCCCEGPSTHLSGCPLPGVSSWEQNCWQA